MVVEKLSKTRAAQSQRGPDRWPDELRLSDVEPRFVCAACGKRGADVRPAFNWGKPPVRAMGYR